MVIFGTMLFTGPRETFESFSENDAFLVGFLTSQIKMAYTTHVELRNRDHKHAGVPRCGHCVTLLEYEVVEIL